SLRFNSMNMRHYTISDTHRKTFDWIFQSHLLPDNDSRSKIKFPDWLRSDNNIYWITSKPS
ncbi:hypothetical protein K469DRAFT_461719, partial [Zopfia rhizophila CBS 207.26]